MKSNLEMATMMAVEKWVGQEETPWLHHPLYTNMQMKRMGKFWLYVSKNTDRISDYSWHVQGTWDGKSIVLCNAQFHDFTEESAKECAEAVVRCMLKDLEVRKGK